MALTATTDYWNGFGDYIGRRGPEFGTYPFDGKIDDVIIFGNALSPEEVAALYINYSSYDTSKDFSGLSEGTHGITVYAQDSGGNVDTDTRFFASGIMYGSRVPDPWVWNFFIA